MEMVDGISLENRFKQKEIEDGAVYLRKPMTKLTFLDLAI